MMVSLCDLQSNPGVDKLDSLSVSLGTKMFSIFCL